LQFIRLDQLGVAWWDHIGGFVSGSLLITVIKRAGLPLFDLTAEGVGGNK
jgi:membrane associated rhomboid family serine protease